MLMKSYVVVNLMNYKKHSKLKALRESKDLSQSQLAKASGVNVRTIQDYEQGRRDISKASYSIINKLAEALNVPIESIL